MSYLLGCCLVIGSFGMSCKTRDSGFNPHSRSFLGLLIEGFGGWGHVFKVYSLRVGLKGPTLVRFHVVKIYFII